MIFGMLLSIFLIPLCGSLVILALSPVLSKKFAGWLTFVFTAATFIMSLSVALYPPKIKSITVAMPWAKFLGMHLTVYHDLLSSIVLLVSTAVASLAILYSIGYFKEEKDFRSGGFYSLVLLFLAGLIGVTLSANLIMFYIFWEMMLLPTFAFVAYFGEDKVRSGAIALKYFIFTHVGAVLMLAGFLVIYAAAGTSDMIILRSILPVINQDTLKIASLLIIVGLAIKMAIFPLHSWLPETYANAPMPATILMSAVMMNAPIYAFIRFFLTLLPIQAVAPYLFVLMIFAVISQFYGALMAFSEKNIKRIIAYSSISQMGYVLFGIGTFSFLGLSGSTFHLINHAIIKALLFMSVGAVYFTTKKYDMKDLGGLAIALPVTALCGTVGALAISGVPLFGAFQSELLIFAGGLKSAYPVLGVLAVAGALFTAAYALRFVADIFFNTIKTNPFTKVPWEMTVSMLVLSVAILVIGVYPFFFSRLAQEAIRIMGV